MFSRIASSASSSRTALVAAGSALGGASGAASYLLSSDGISTTADLAKCESSAKPPASTRPTVLSLLNEISSRVSRIEQSLGISDSSSSSSSISSAAAISNGPSGGQKHELLSRRKTTMASKNHGVDIVLGAQWGDEGKGKLVDMLSQVRSPL